MRKGIFGYLITTGLVLFLIFFIITGLWIGNDAKKHCQQAKLEYGGTCVEALISWLNDENQDFRSRNSAIWALGQLGDKQALPVLEKYYTGQIPDKESLDKGISQYELKKAIKLTSGGFNATVIFWRYNID